MSKKGIVQVVVVVLLVLNTATLVYLLLERKSESRDPFSHPLHGPKGKHGLERELDFSDAQSKSFEQLRKEHHSAMMLIQDSIHSVKEAYFDLVVSDSSQKSTFLLNQIGELEKRKDALTFAHFKQVYQLCNAEQKRIFLSVMKRALHRIAPPPPPGAPHPPHGPIPPPPPPPPPGE